VAALTLAMTVILFWSGVFGGKVLSNGDVIFWLGPWSGEKPSSLVYPSNPGIDDQTYLYPTDMLVTRRALAAGEAPLWNPYQAGGRPLLASEVYAPLFPPDALTLVLPFWRSQVLAVALKLLLAALGIYLLARGCGLRPGSATFVATVYTFSAYMLSWVLSPIGNSMAMAPWVLAMTARVVAQARWRDAAGLAVAVGLLILGGHPETIIFTLGAAALFALAEYFRAPRTVLAHRRSLLLGTGLLLGAGLTAVMLLPFAQLLLLSSGTSRAAGPYGANIAYAFAFPELWGNPSKLIGDFGPINYSVRTAYLGALPLLLAVGGVFARRPRGAHLEWILLTLLAALMVMPTPVHDLAAHLPVLDRTNLLSTMFLTVLGGSMLAGMGIQAWLDADRAARRRMLIAIGVTTLIPLAVLMRNTNPFAHIGTALGQLPALHSSFTQSGLIKNVVAWRWIVFCAAGIAVLLLVHRFSGRWVSLAAVLLVAVDLITLDRGFQPAIPLSRVDPPTPPALAYLEAHQGDQRISGTFAKPTPALLPDLAERYGLRDIQTYDVPKTNRFRALWAGLGQDPGDLSWWDPTVSRAHAALDLFAVRYVLLAPGMRSPPWLKPVFRQGNETVAENPTALPRAWVSYRWRTAANDGVALAQTLSSSTTELLRAPVIEHAPADPGRAGTAPVRVTLDQNERVELEVTAQRPGYVVLDDAYYPGWSATVDRHPAPVLTANDYFRAVRVGPGTHRITFSYRPAVAKIGAGITLLSLAVLCFVPLAVWLLRRRRLHTTRLNTTTDRNGTGTSVLAP
jgi:hypothetical protein